LLEEADVTLFDNIDALERDNILLNNRLDAASNERTDLQNKVNLFNHGL
jgi:hypothetical protein